MALPGDPPPTGRRYAELYRRLRRFRDDHPRLQPALRALNRITRVRPPVTFRGWGMTTEHALPWDDEHAWGTFRDSLVQLRSFSFTGEAGIDRATVDVLAWRHWVVAFAVEQALSSTPRTAPVAIAECGVADGTTAYVALRELERHEANGGPAFLAHLYDSWAAMDPTTLTASERDKEGRYANLSLDATKQNLEHFADRCTYHVGLVPGTFSVEPASPDEVVFVHVDLNASLPTLQVCEFFWPRLAGGGVMLFDDYGWLGFEDTKAVVDHFFAGKPGALLKLPTGQAMFLRSCAS